MTEARASFAAVLHDLFELRLLADASVLQVDDLRGELVDAFEPRFDVLGRARAVRATEHLAENIRAPEPAACSFFGRRDRRRRRPRAHRELDLRLGWDLRADL